MFLVPHARASMATVLAQNADATDEKIIERYKLMLERKPKEGSTFDRLYHFYVEGAGVGANGRRLSSRDRSRAKQGKPPIDFGTYLQTVRQDIRKP